MDVEPSKDALFNEVYDQEHVPLIRTVPGVIAATRFRKQELTMIIGGEPLRAGEPGRPHQ
jgi:hypothetical protein